MYQGKFDAKYRGTSPLPRRTEEPGQERSAAVAQAPAKKKSSVGTVIFYTIYCLFIALFAGAMFFVMQWLNGWLVSYEASQPSYKRDEVFMQLFDEPDWAALYDQIDIQDSQFEGKDAFVSYMSSKVAGQELTYMETSAGLSGDKKYYVKLGDEKIGSFTLTSTDNPATGIPQWDLGELELFYEYPNQVMVQTQNGHTVYINGIPLDDSYTIQIGSTLAESYLPAGVHGMRIYTQKVTGLMAEPEVTVKDKDGNDVPVSYNQETGMYVAQTSVNTIGEAEQKAALNAGRTYALYMIEKAYKGDLARYFDSNSKIYKTITSMNLWMQSSSGHEFANESVTGYCRYSDDLFSARVSLSLNVTRNNGTVKEYTVDSTLFFKKQAGGNWLCTEMTNVDVQQQIAEVRITFMSDGVQLTTGFYDAESKQLTTPVITAPEGKVFSGWYKEDVDANGVKTLTLVFGPGENGQVTVAEGYTLEPMTLFALFEDAQTETEVTE